MNLLALTTCVVDYYPQLKKSFLGGNSLNVASMWKKLKPQAEVSVISCLGNDENGKLISNFLNNKGINTSHVYINNGITANNQLKVDDEGERYGIEGTWDGGLYETFLLSEDDWIYIEKQDIIAIPGNNPNFPEMLKRKGANQILAVDYLDIENNVKIEDSIQFTDIAFITAREDLLAKYQELSTKSGKLLVVTLGAKGSYAFFDGKEYHQPAIDVTKVIDTTGCGDAYQAAFSLSYYETGNIEVSMNAGANAASTILQAYGGVGKQ